MAHVHYRLVEHDGGWAYTAEGVFSETYPDHDSAAAAARLAAAEQRAPDDTTAIDQDESGAWRVELAQGEDRPTTDVED